MAIKRITRLKICNITLLILTVIIFASGVQLEVNPHGNSAFVWFHIAAGAFFLALTIIHIRLNKPPRCRKQSHRASPAMRWLALFFLLTIISSVVATCHWTATMTHSATGAIHGKIGFIFIFLCSIHAFRYRRFFANLMKHPSKTNR